MSERESIKQSPLVGCPGVEAPSLLNGVQLRESAFFSHINIRADATDTKVMAALSNLVGVPLPTRPNHCETTQKRNAFWLGPDEWLVIDAGTDERLAEELNASIKVATDLHGQHIALTDVSGGQTVIRLTGSHAVNALQRGCPFDLHPSNFAPGRCAQTHINHINVLLWPEVGVDSSDGDPLVYNVVVRRSFADYLWRWLRQVQSRLTVSR